MSFVVNPLRFIDCANDAIDEADSIGNVTSIQLVRANVAQAYALVSIAQSLAAIAEKMDAI